jgi:hypothetical protein
LIFACGVCPTRLRRDYWVGLQFSVGLLKDTAGIPADHVAPIGLAARHRVPAVYPFRYFAASGGLMSYGTDVAEVFRRAARAVNLLNTPP